MSARHIYHVTSNEQGEWSVHKELIRFDNQQEAIDFAHLLAKLDASGTYNVVCRPQLERTVSV